MVIVKIKLTAVVLACAAALAGCATVERVAYTKAEANDARPLGLDHVRVWADAPVRDFSAPEFRPGTTKAQRVSYLALSGGGGDGAYGAGILNGWSASGTRPVFNIVSGVSTGALTAPFAFLGASYDGVLKDIYTSGNGEELVQSPDLFRAVFSAGLFGDDRLRKLVGRYVDQPFLDAIAAEQTKGRRLFVVTTNLDSQRGVIWNMGAIAASKAPGSVELFRDVLAASASVPVVFSPALIKVQTDSRQFEEMHVDGAVTTAVFALPPQFLLRPGATGAAFQNGAIYVLMNGRIEPQFSVVAEEGLKVAGKSLDMLGKQQTRANLLATMAFAKQNHISFNLTFIGNRVPEGKVGGFDTRYMQALFDYGYDKAKGGTFWLPAPPSAAEDAAMASR